MTSAAPLTLAPAAESSREETGRGAVLVFLLAAALLLLLNGNRYVLTNDEGILLEPARLMAQGQRPYVDFWGYMSPGSYWIQMALFQLLGLKLWVARLPVILDLAAQCAMLFWLTARLSSRRAATAAAIVFLGFQIADPAFLTAQHRWDSGTFALAGVCLAVAGISSARSSAQNRTCFAGSGAALAAAAWCTPSMVPLLAIAFGWLLASRDRRSRAIPYLTGAAAVTGAASAWLAAHGAFGAFVQQMLWLQKNYAEVNVMPYGSVIGGYAKLFESAAGFELFLRALLVACLALPAVVPPAALLLWGVAHLRRKIPEEARAATPLLLLAVAALVATTVPRSDLMHLEFVAALPYALAAAALARLLSVRAGAIVAFTILPFALLFSMNDVAAWFHTRAVESPVGRVRVSVPMAPELERLLAAVHPGDRMFVYPYMPIQYFVTQSVNPTRFCYLQPGLMPRQDAMQALGELEQNPPEWLLYMPLTREEFLRVFPNARSLDQRFEDLESWLNRNYQLDEQADVDIAGYRLWRRMAPGAPPARAR